MSIKTFSVRKMITDKKICKHVFIAMSVLFAVGLIVSVICNAAVSRTLSWSLYVLGGTVIVWCVLAPLLLMKKNKFLWSLIAFSVAIIPLLWAIEWISSTSGWFSGLGLPISVVSVIALWITFFLMKFVQKYPWFVSGCLVLLYGVVLQAVINYLVNRYVSVQYLEPLMQESIFSFNPSYLYTVSIAVNTISGGAIAALLFVLGGSRKKGKKEEAETTEE